LGAANGTWSGGVTVNAGALRLTSATGAGSGTISISPTAAVTGAALQLSGGITVNNPLTLQGINNVALGGINFGGQLQSVSGINTYSGVISMPFDAAIGADSGATLNINGGINNTTSTGRSVLFTGAGTINLNSNLTASTTPTANQYFALQKYGSGTLNITTANTIVPTNNITVFEGAMSLNGAGTLAGGNAIAATVNPGATLSLDNAGTLVSNRLGGRPVTLLGGNLNLLTNAATTNETVGAISFNRGFSTVTVTAGAGGANLTFGAPNNPSANQNVGPSGATVLFRGTSLGTAAGANVATIKSSTTGFTFVGQTGGSGTATKGILPWALVDTSATGLGNSFATADTATSILRPLAANEYQATANTLTSTNNILLTQYPLILSRSVEMPPSPSMRPLQVCLRH
jgi:hypothetical protein